MKTFSVLKLKKKIFFSFCNALFPLKVFFFLTALFLVGLKTLISISINKLNNINIVWQTTLSENKMHIKTLVMIFIIFIKQIIYILWFYLATQNPKIKSFSSLFLMSYLKSLSIFPWLFVVLLWRRNRFTKVVFFKQKKTTNRCENGKSPNDCIYEA